MVVSAAVTVVEATKAKEATAFRNVAPVRVPTATSVGVVVVVSVGVAVAAAVAVEEAVTASVRAAKSGLVLLSVRMPHCSYLPMANS